MHPIDGIVKFNIDRRLSSFNGMSEYNMLYEELQELLTALAYEDTHEIIDAFCDMIVIATGAIYKLGCDPTKALEQTVMEISSRQGSFNESTGKWEKDPNQDPDTLYKADYLLAK